MKKLILTIMAVSSVSTFATDWEFYGGNAVNTYNYYDNVKSNDAFTNSLREQRQREIEAQRQRAIIRDEMRKQNQRNSYFND